MMAGEEVISTLGIGVKTAEVKEAATDLNDLVGAAVKAEKGADDLNASFMKLGKSADELRQQQEKVNDAMAKATTAAANVTVGQVQAVQSIDRLTDSYIQYSRSQETTIAQNDAWIASLMRASIAHNKTASEMLEIEAAGRKLTAGQEEQLKHIQDLNAANEQQENRWKSLGMELLKVAGITVGVVEALRRCIEAAVEAEDSQLKLEAMLRATGNTTGHTSQELMKLAEEMQKVSRFDHTQIEAAEASLSKFGAVSGENFERAVKLSADLATVMGRDVAGAAELVGRALENTYGMSMLRRQGMLTDAQIANLKVMKELGREVEFQNQLFTDLEGRVGGVAEAMGQKGMGGAWAQFKNAFGDSMELVGQFLLSMMNVEKITRSIVEGLEHMNAKVKEISESKEPEWLMNLAEKVSQAGNVLSGQAYANVANNREGPDPLLANLPDRWDRSVAAERQAAQTKELELAKANEDQVKKWDTAVQSFTTHHQTAAQVADAVTKAWNSNNEGALRLMVTYGTLDAAISSIVDAMVKVPKGHAYTGITDEIAKLNEEYGKISGADGGMTHFQQAMDFINKQQLEGHKLTLDQIATILALGGAIDDAVDKHKRYAQALKDAADRVKEEDAARKESQKTVEDLLKSEDKYELGLQKKVQTMAMQVSMMGQTALAQKIAASNNQIDLELQTRLLDIEERRKKEGWSEAVTQGLKDQAIAAADAAKATLDYYIRIGDAQQEYISNQKAAWDEVNNITQNFFSDLFTNGHNAFKNLGESLKKDLIQVLYEMTVKKWVFQIFADVQGGGGTSAGLANSVMGGGAGSFGTGSIGNYISGANTVSGWFGGPSTNSIMSGIGSSAMAAYGGIGADVAAGYGAGAAGAFTGGAEAFMAGSTAVEAGAGLGVSAGAGAAAGGIEAGLAAGLAAVPVAGWVALAALIVYSIFSNMPKGGPKSGGFASLDGTAGLSVDSDNSRYYTPNQGDVAMQTTVKNMATVYNSTMTALGGTAGKVNFGLGYDTDPMGKANNRVSAGASINGVSVYDARNIDTGNRDDADLQKQLATQSQRAILGALQASDLPANIAKLLNSVTAMTATDQQITDLLSLAATYKQINDALTNLPKTVSDNLVKALDNTAATAARVLNLANALHNVQTVMNADPVDDALKAIAAAATPAYTTLNNMTVAMKDLIKNFDGTDTAITNLSAATVQYYNAQVALIAQIEQIKTAVGGMFSSTIESFKLSVMSPQQQYDYYQKNADDTYKLLLAEKDPVKIQAYANKINDDYNKAFGLLSTDDKTANVDKFVTNINKVNDVIQKGLTGTETDAQNTVAGLMTAIRPLLEGVAQDMADAAQKQIDAANKQNTAADTPLNVDVKVDLTDNRVTIGTEVFSNNGGN